MDLVQGVGVGGGKLREYEYVRTALVMTLQHKYIQLSSSNHTLLIRSRTGTVLAFKLWPNTICIIVARCKFLNMLSVLHCVLCSKTALKMTVIPL